MAESSPLKKPLTYGEVVVVTSGPEKGRVAVYEDDETYFGEQIDATVFEYLEFETELAPRLSLDEETGERSIALDMVYLQVSKRFELAHYEVLVPTTCIRLPSLDDLVQRAASIERMMTNDRHVDDPDWEEMFFAAEELALAELEIRRRERRQIAESEAAGIAAFLCHSSVDKPFVRRIHQDLRSVGLTAFLDEAEIRVGDSFVGKISDALGATDHLVVFLSRDSIESVWVKKEWQSFLAALLAEDDERRILPVMIEECEVPALLKDLHYADFRASYNNGLSELVRGFGIDGLGRDT